jgi:hypothetical protein
MRHCVASCESARAIDNVTAQLAGIINELQGLFLFDLRLIIQTIMGRRDPAFQVDDMVDNWEGGQCAAKKGVDCDCCCYCYYFGGSNYKGDINESESNVA